MVERCSLQLYARNITNISTLNGRNSLQLTLARERFTSGNSIATCDLNSTEQIFMFLCWGHPCVLKAHWSDSHWSDISTNFYNKFTQGCAQWSDRTLIRQPFRSTFQYLYALIFSDTLTTRTAHLFVIKI